MRESKRLRTIGPTSSSSSLPPSAPSAPSSDASPPASTQSLSDLRQRLARVKHSSSKPSVWQPVPSSSPAMGGGEASRTRETGSGQLGRVEEARGMNDKDHDMDVEVVTVAKDEVQSPSDATWRTSRPSLAAFAASNEASQASGSQAVAPSPTQRRSKEEIEQRKEAAMALRKQKDKEKVAQARQLERAKLAKFSLESFGFNLNGMSRYGSGSGGVAVKPEPGAAPVVKQEWKPDDRCSSEQKLVLEQVRNGGNVFFTGSAGVGKSFLLQEITRLLEHLERPFQVTATTGIASLQVSGITIHSWAGVGLGKDPIPILYDKISSRKEAKKKWLETQVLIIDEVSMSPPDLFTKLNILGKMLRNSKEPFGGLQLIVSGDFFQLPPVPDRKSDEKCMRCGHQNLQKIPIHDSRLPYEERAGGVVSEIYRCTDAKKRNGEVIAGCGFEFRERKFCFETEAWAECNFKIMELTKVFRQDAPEFIATLEKFRRGICDESCVSFLARCGKGLQEGGTIKIQERPLPLLPPTNLYPLRKDVDSENKREFAKLKETTHVFEALDDSKGDYARSTMKERLALLQVGPTLQLKKGAQVLLMANLDVKGGLVNGSRGVIVDWVDRNDVPVDAEEDERMPSFTQKPGVQGGRFGGEEWRAKAAEDWADNQKDTVFYPVVYFATGKQLVIKPHSWAVDIDKNNSVARTQLPLQLAWALTIHKSQGQSLDAVRVRLTATFEKGQAYVALSRCRTPEGMRIEGFKPSVVMAHATVKIYYDCIAAKSSFFVTPVPPVNPISFIPDFDPLRLKLTKTFGRPPAPLAIGSAVLAPGQKKAPLRQQPPPPPPPHITSASATSSSSTTQTLVPIPVGSTFTDWRSLLALAAQAYVVESSKLTNHNDGIIDDSSNFLNEARTAVLSASGGTAYMVIDGAGGGGGSEYETCESAGSTSGTGTGGAEAPQQDGVGKKSKKKRWRKRIGH